MGIYHTCLAAPPQKVSIAFFINVATETKISLPDFTSAHELRTTEKWQNLSRNVHCKCVNVKHPDFVLSSADTSLKRWQLYN